eukprot:5644153-Pyramimonas_sp.AAC.1
MTHNPGTVAGWTESQFAPAAPSWSCHGSAWRAGRAKCCLLFKRNPHGASAQRVGHPEDPVPRLFMLQIAPKWPTTASKTVKRAQDGPPDGPKMSPRWPRWPKENPRPPKKASRLPKTAQEASTTAPEVSKKSSTKTRKGQDHRFDIGF